MPNGDQTVHAFLESEDRSAVATYIAPPVDTHFSEQSSDILRMINYTKIALMYMKTSTDSYKALSGTLKHPNTRAPLRIMVGSGLNVDPEAVYDYRENPLAMINQADNTTFEGVETDEVGVAHYLGLALIVSDGPIQTARPPPPTHLVRCTLGTAPVARAWTTSALAETAGEELAAGRYGCQGAIVYSAEAFAARFQFQGYPVYPATIPTTGPTQPVHKFSRWWGKEYLVTMPAGLPAIQLLSMGTTASTVDLILRYLGPLARR